MRQRKLAWLAMGAGALSTAIVLVRVALPGPWPAQSRLDAFLLLALALAGVALALGLAALRLMPPRPLLFSDDTYQMLFRLNPQPMFIIDLGGHRFLDVNQAALELYGYGRSEFLARTPADIRPPGEVGRFQQHIRAVPPGLQRHGLWRHLHRDGTPLVVEPVTHDMEYEGEPALLVMISDVTGRHAAEKALQVTGRTLEAVVDASPLAIAVLDGDQHVQLWNAAAERMFGWMADEVIGRRSPLLVDRAETEFDAILSRVLGGENIAALQVRRRRKDGSWLDVSLATATVPGLAGEADGGGSWIIGIFTDITEQLRTAEALRASEARYRELLEQASDGILLMDDAGRLLGSNTTACEMLGYTADEMLGMTAQDLEAPESLEDRPPQLAELRLGRTTVTQRTMQRKDGTRLSVEISSRMMSSGEIHAIVRDITERQRLEEQLRQSQKMEAVGRLAGGIAHDFNNILTAISGYTRLMSDEMDGDDRFADDLQQIIANTERASGLTRQLLAFSRKQVIQPRVLDVNVVIRDMGKLIHRVIGEDVRLVEELDASVGRIRLDPGELEQVVMNLVVNARDAMPNGGVLRIATGEADVPGDLRDACVIQAEPGRYVTLAVSDNGTGIEADVLSTIFEPFFTTKAPGKGTGLGLSTVYGIMEQAGGSIAVDSEVGRGTTFVVCFPRLDAATDAEPTIREESAAARGGTETVLLVEDESAVRSLAARILRRSGYTVLEAEDAQGALDCMAGHDGDIHLLLTDVIMPGANGRELAKTIKAARPGVRILYMSGYMADEVGRAGVAENGAFLPKPFTPAALAAKVREVLEA